MAEKKKSTYFGIPRLMGLSFLVSFNKNLAKNARGIFKPQQAKRQETFEEAASRLKLTEVDIQRRMREFLHLAIGFAALALLVLAYTVYLFWCGDIAAGMLGSLVTLITLTQVFRYHFWYFQMKKRKLGCTFKEWLKF